jgi:hypothetical protein
MNVFLWDSTVKGEVGSYPNIFALRPPTIAGPGWSAARLVRPDFSCGQNQSYGLTIALLAAREATRQ